MESRFVNPFTDYGFKKLFGEEASKPSLIDFLNSLLPDNVQIKDLTFKNTEQLGVSNNNRRAVFDIYCEGNNGEKFIVELQKAKQNYFRERTIYYSTFPIIEQALKGDEWNFNLTTVFCIGVLDFKFNDYGDEEDRKLVKHIIKLKNQFGKTFYEKLTYIYLEMPNFNRKEEELATRFDKWLFFIKNLRDFQSIPEIFHNDVVFQPAFKTAEVANYTAEERAKYDDSLLIYWDMKNVIETAEEEARAEGVTEGIEKGIELGIEKGMEKGIELGIEKGIEKGIELGIEKGKEKGKTEVAVSLLQSGIEVEIISKATGLTSAEIMVLRNNYLK